MSPPDLHRDLLANLGRLAPPPCLHYADDSDFRGLGEYIAELTDAINAHVHRLGHFCAEHSHEVKPHGFTPDVFAEIIHADKLADIIGALAIAAQDYRQNHAGDHQNRRMTEERV